ncbi:MAG TPA: sugar ABC transporter permease [Tepidisphaeraceae bacterium]|nr:sugar ABC transporter permease [Tepidisphaeraceae bacterium]
MTTVSAPQPAAPAPRPAGGFSAPPPAPAASVYQRPGLWLRMKKHRHFYFFVAPFFVLFGLFGLYPLVFSLFLSFVKWDGLTPMRWVGLGNFSVMLDDEILLTSLWNTLVIGMLYIPPMLALAFLLALALNTSWLRARAILRASIFLPCVTPMVVIAIVFGLLLSAEHGLLNHALSYVGLGPVAWLNSVEWSKPSIALLVIWRWTGYNMVLMLAGLQGISADYYEAASVDGATRWRAMWHVTLPLMRPTFVFCMILSLLGTVYMFDEVFVLTKGGPGTSSTNFGLYLFNLSFNDFRFGYASCVAYTVSVGVLIVSLVLNRFRHGHGSDA